MVLSLGAKNNWAYLWHNERVWRRYTCKYVGWRGRNLYQYGRYLGRKNPLAMFFWPLVAYYKQNKGAK